MNTESKNEQQASLGFKPESINDKVNISKECSDMNMLIASSNLPEIKEKPEITESTVLQQMSKTLSAAIKSSDDKVNISKEFSETKMLNTSSNLPEINKEPEITESTVASQNSKILSAAVESCEGTKDALQTKPQVGSFSIQSDEDTLTKVEEQVIQCSSSKEDAGEDGGVASVTTCSSKLAEDEVADSSTNSHDSREFTSSTDVVSETCSESTCVDVTVDKPDQVDSRLEANDCDEPDTDHRDPAYSPPCSSCCSDAQSEGSSDSGKGSSDVHTPAPGTPNITALPDCIAYEFEIARDLCGILIGKKGAHVNMIKEKTGAFISVQTHPFDTNFSLCAVIGTKEEIDKALILVRKKFPLDQYPDVTLAQVQTMTQAATPVAPQAAQLHLPEGVMCEVIVAGVVSAGHLFLQQPTHPTYPSLARLDQAMQACYSLADTPEMPRPVEAGHICAAPLSGGWYRAQVSAAYPETDECEVKFVDHGVYSQLPISALRQIRSDFMYLPFQAEECYLAHITPISDDMTWSDEAQACVENLSKGQILEAQIISYAEDGLPIVDLYRIQGSSYVLINRELTDRGLARWVEG